MQKDTLKTKTKNNLESRSKPIMAFFQGTPSWNDRKENLYED